MEQWRVGRRGEYLTRLGDCGGEGRGRLEAPSGARTQEAALQQGDLTGGRGSGGADGGGREEGRSQLGRRREPGSCCVLPEGKAKALNQDSDNSGMWAEEASRARKCVSCRAGVGESKIKDAMSTFSMGDAVHSGATA